MGDLKKSLTAARGTAVMLNIVLGAGLLTLPGLAVAQADDDALLVWLTCAVVSVPLLVAFAIIGRHYPDSGGLAMFARSAFGDFGFVLVTLLFLGAVLFGLPSIALTGGYYAAEAFGGSAYAYANGVFLIAVLANIVSAEWTSRINVLIATVLVLCLSTLVLAGFAVVELDSLSVMPSVPPTVSAQVFGATFMMVFFAFTGWEVAANLSGEFHNPRRDFPLAMAFSFMIAVLLYCALAIIAGGISAAGRAEVPFIALFEMQFGYAGSVAISLIAVLLVIANLAAAVWAVSRMVWAAGIDRLLPSALGKTSNGRPLLAVVCTIAALLSVLLLSAVRVFDLQSMLALAGQNFLLIYGVSAAGLIVCSTRPAVKVLGMVCVAEVFVLVALRGGDGAVFPLSLAMLAVLIFRFRQHAVSNAPMYKRWRLR